MSNSRYAVFTLRSYPDAKYEYCFASLVEAEAMVACDTKRIKQYHDYCIVGNENSSMLALFAESQLRGMARSLGVDIDSGGVQFTKNDLISKIIRRLNEVDLWTVPETFMKTYELKKVDELSTQRQENDMMNEDTGAGAEAVETTAPKAKEPKKAKKKATTKSTTESRGKSAKKALASPKAKKKSATAGQKNTNDSVKDPLGRPGTTFRFCADMIMAGKNNEQIAAAASKKFPDGKATDVKAAAWYRWSLKKRGVKAVPDNA